MKVLFTYDYGKEKFDKVRQLGYEIALINETHFIEQEVDYSADVLCCYTPFDRLDLSKFKNLKLIQLSSIGFDTLPKEEVLRLDIPVANNRGGYSIPMGEFIVYNILQLAKHNRQFLKKQEEKRWKIDSGLMELVGKTVVFLGTGTIAVEGAKRLQGFDMKVIGLNTAGRSEQYFDETYPLDQGQAILAKADFVVMVLPFTPQTAHYLNKERLSWLKPSAYLINVSRGNVVDEKALVEVLQAGTLAGAALDVFEEEPLPQDSSLWEMDHVYLTPHNSWISEMRNERRFDLILENLSRLQSGQPLLNLIQIRRGY